MPWRECNVMDERVKFVARLLEGEKTKTSGFDGQIAFIDLVVSLNDF